MRKVGGPDARAGGTVLSSEFSEAGTIVRLRDAGGTVWRCIGYSDGTVGELRVINAADDGEGAMAGASSQPDGEPSTTEERIRFHSGASETSRSGSLTPGSSIRYVLRANNGQFLDVNVDAHGPDIYYQIFNPDNSFLLEQMDPGKDYRGQLWQSGKHVVEVINRGNRTTRYNVTFRIN